MPLAQELNMYLQLLQPLLLPLRVIPLLWMLLINQRVKLLVLLLELELHHKKRSLQIQLAE
jgi:hypothetical protein